MGAFPKDNILTLDVPVALHGLLPTFEKKQRA